MLRTGHERRKYYRINDEVLLHYTTETPTQAGASEGVNVELAVGSILAEIDLELNHTISRVWAADPDIGRALGLLNRKISVLGSLADTAEGEGPTSYQRTQVSLSGSGIAFEATESLPVDTKLVIDIGLLPSHAKLRLNGHVVASPEPLVDHPGHYWTRVEFDDEANQQEELIRHVVQKQGMLLADRR